MLDNLTLQGNIVATQLVNQTIHDYWTNVSCYFTVDTDRCCMSDVFDGLCATLWQPGCWCLHFHHQPWYGIYSIVDQYILVLKYYFGHHKGRFWDSDRYYSSHDLFFTSILLCSLLLICTVWLRYCLQYSCWCDTQCVWYGGRSECYLIRVPTVMVDFYRTRSQTVIKMCSHHLFPVVDKSCYQFVTIVDDGSRLAYKFVRTSSIFSPHITSC